MSDFENKVAFITGAAHGQGRATALALAKEGADIVAFDVAKKIEYPAYSFGTSDELKSLKEEVEALGRRCLIAAGDVRDDKAVTDAVDRAIADRHPQSCSPHDGSKERRYHQQLVRYGSARR